MIIDGSEVTGTYCYEGAAGLNRLIIEWHNPSCIGHSLAHELQKHDRSQIGDQP